MTVRKWLRPGALVLMAGILPLAVSQAHAQSPSTTSLLSTRAMTLISVPTKENSDTNSDQIGDFTLGETDLLGAPDVTSFAHAGSGIGSGWLVGGALGAAAGLVGLASGSGGSATAIELRTPSGLPVVIASTGLDSTAGVPVGPGAGVPGFTSVGVPVSPVTGVSVDLTGAGNGVPQAGGSNPTAGGLITLVAPTPEPGSLALLSGMGLMLTAARMRRRKR